MGILEKSLEKVALGEPVSYENLTLFPLLCEQARESDYLTLDTALLRKTIRITEISEQGSVPELLLTNDAAQPVLLLDGEELIGAKQNRIINLSILAPAHSTINIPVSCVEAGRWSHRSEEFTSSSALHYSTGRAEKMAQVSESLRHSRSRRSDQGAVWNSISMKAACMNTASATDAMSDIYRSHSSSVKDYCRHFAAAPAQIGAIFATDAEIKGMELFDSQATFANLLPKLLQSYALDAIDPSMHKPGVTALDAAAAQSLLAETAALDGEAFPAIGLGEDIRLDTDALCGGALVHNEKLVHLCIFRITRANTEDGRDRRMRAASFRAQNRRYH